MPIPRFEIGACPRPRSIACERELGVSGRDRPGAGATRIRRAGRARARSWPPTTNIRPQRSPASQRRSRRSSRRSASGERITIHGDYDVDGVCSTAVLVRALRGLGANVDSYLPDRASDGYGLNEDTVRRLAARGTRLLITVDCAITAVEQVDAARALGMRGGRHRSSCSARRRRAARRADRAPAASAAIRAPSCARPASPTSWRRRSGRQPRAGRIGVSSRRTSTSWRWPRSPMWSRWWVRTARSFAAACARWPPRRSPGCVR